MKKRNEWKRGLAVLLSVCMVFGMVPVQTRAAGTEPQADNSADTYTAASGHYDDNGFCTGYEIASAGSGAWVKKSGEDACTDENCNGYQPMTTATEDGTTWYEISNAGQLYWFASQVDNGNLLDANVRLTADIVDNEGVTFGWDENNDYAVVATKDGQTVDASTLRMWNPIGNLDSDHEFEGHFDGQGHSISGLYHSGKQKGQVGIFQKLMGKSADNHVIAERVGLENSYLQGQNQAGGIVGYAKNATIKQCYNAAYILAARRVGGIIAALDGKIELSELYNVGKLTFVGNIEERYIGQIVGNVESTDEFQFSSCYERSDLNIDFYGRGTYYNVENTFLSKESFYNGEVAYLLSQSTGSAWGQDLSSENSLPNPCASDKYPVYKTCNGYTNDASKVHHSVVNGFCTNDGCDYYEEPHYNETDGVYEISNAGQLYAYADKAQTQTAYIKSARLTADIVVNEETLIQEDGTPITETADLRKWKGMFRNGGAQMYYDQKLTFDGNNHSISGLYAKGSGRQGFVLYNYGTVKNLQIKNSVFISTGNGEAGGIAAGDRRADYAEIENCSFEGYVEGTEYTGGIAGRNITTSNCYVDAYVKGSGTVDPIVARSGSSGSINNTAYNKDKYTAECTTSGVKGFTTDQFAFGEVAYTLNKGNSDTTTDIWKQTLDGESKDSTPTLNTSKENVYRYERLRCDGAAKTTDDDKYAYTNDSSKSGKSIKDAHVYEIDSSDHTHHKCKVCGDEVEHNYTYKVEDGTTDTLQAVCDVCGDSYTVKLTAPAGADGKLTYTGDRLAARTEITDGTLGETLPKIEYATVTDGTVSAYSTDVPVNAGSYQARLTLGSGDNVVSATVNYTIAKATPTIAWSENQTKQSATYTGEKIAVSKITAPNVALLKGDTFSDNSKITYSYRKVKDGIATGDFISGLPADIGTYEIKAAIPADGNYTAAETTGVMQLTIAYLKSAPDAVVTDKNNKTYASDDWYPSDIVLKAPDGYKISSTANGGYEASFTYTGTTENETITYYLKADNSGEIAEKSVTVKMDRTAPDWSGDKLGIRIKSTWWNKLLSSITFGLYKGSSLEVYANANDSQSGVTEYYYYIDKTDSTTVLTVEELDSLVVQNKFDKVNVTEESSGTTKLKEITEDNNYVIYAYAVDAVGNRSAYISSDGVVLDNTAPKISDVKQPTKEGNTLTDTTATITFTGSEAGTYYYILREDGKSAPTLMSDFAMRTAGDKVDTWTALDGVSTGTLTADEGNTIKLTGLKANTSYVLYLAATDAAGNASVVESAGEDRDSGIVSVSFTTTKMITYVKTAPVLSGTYGDTVSAMFMNADMSKASVTAGTDGTKFVNGSWSVASEDADEIPTVGTNETYTLKFTSADTDTYESVTCEVTPTVAKKPITVVIEDKERAFGEDNPELTWSFATGEGYTDNTYVGSDKETALGISLSTMVTKGSTVGTYPITGTSESANYEVSFTGSGSDGNSGVLTVKQAANSFTTALICSGYTYAKDKTPKPQAEAKFGTVTYKYAKVDSDGNAPTDEAEYTDTVPVNAGIYAVKAYVADTKNYAGIISAPVVFTIAKAAKAPNMPGTAMAPAHSTQKVGNIKLPDGWSWQDIDKDTALADDVTVTATAVYTGADKGNYETESVSITITRSNCEHKNTEIRNKKDATCMGEGYTGDTYCNDCGKEIYKGTVTEKTSHTVGTPATCVSKAICSVCKEEFGELDKTRHVHTTVKNKVDATCTKPGYTGDTYCEDCGAQISMGSESAKLGHDYKSEITRQPTTTEEGVRTYTCSRCNDSYTESIAKITNPYRPSNPYIPGTTPGNSATPSPSPSQTAAPSPTPDETATPSPLPSETATPSPLPSETATPSPLPSETTTPSPLPSETATPSQSPDNQTTPSPTPKAKGTKIKDGKGSTYKVTNAKSKTPTVQYVAPKKTAKGTIVIPATVTIGKVTYKVTSIADNAFKNNKKITKIVIGSNIVSIGKNVFYGCKKLKTITIKSKKLASKYIKKEAFRGVSKKTVLKVPKSKYKVYKKMLYAKGLGKNNKIKKY